MKLIKWIAIFLVLLLICVPSCMKILSKELPAGVVGSEVETVTNKMLEAVNKPAWDSLNYVKWTFFRGKHHYHWDKAQNRAIIEWDDNRVLMNLDEVDGNAYKNNVLQEGDEKTKLIDKAWNFWCNDSFWLCAPYKVKDPGTKREVVKEDGKTGLKVTYDGGGVTPGDVYLWWLDENFFPESWQMWVKIIPVKGVKNSWEKWETLPGGAMISTHHKAGKIKMNLSNLGGGATAESIGKKSTDFDL